MRCSVLSGETIPGSVRGQILIYRDAHRGEFVVERIAGDVEEAIANPGADCAEVFARQTLGEAKRDAPIE